MLVGSFVNHLIHPVTYTIATGEVRYISARDMACITLLVLSSLALTASEALYSSRTLKTSCVAGGIVAGVVFYLATAAMKMASRVSDSPSKKDPPISSELKQAHPEGQNGRIVQTPESSEDLRHSLDSLQVGTVSVQAAPIQVGDAGVVVPPRVDTVLPTGPVVQEAERLPVASSSASAVPLRLNGHIQAQKTYQQLVVADNEAQVISAMIRMINDTMAPALLLKESELIQMGKQIEQVHPLKFLETVLNTPVIKKAMQEIEGSWVPVKWKGFLYGKGESPGFVAKCDREDKLGHVAPYLADFCRAVKVDIKKVRPFYDAKNWEEFIRFLVTSK